MDQQRLGGEDLMDASAIGSDGLQFGLCNCKHARAVFHPDYGLVVAGGDRLVSTARINFSNGTGTEILAYDGRVERGWRILRPYCVAGSVQPIAADNVLWVIDRTRNRGLMSPGFMGGSTPVCAAIFGWGGYAFDFATMTFDGPDTVYPPPAAGWESGDDHGAWGVLDTSMDEVVRLIDYKLERMHLGTKVWRTANVYPQPTSTNHTQTAIDVVGRALYLQNPYDVNTGLFAPTLVKVHLDDTDASGNAVVEKIPLPAFVEPVDSSAEYYLAFDPRTRILVVPNNLAMGGSYPTVLLYHVDTGQQEYITPPAAVSGQLWSYDEHLEAIVIIGKRTGTPGYPFATYLFRAA